MADAYKKKQLTHEEIEKLVTEAFPVADSRCTMLCAVSLNLDEALQDPDLTPQRKKQILLQLHAISVQIRQLHCRCPPPQ